MARANPVKASPICMLAKVSVPKKLTSYASGVFVNAYLWETLTSSKKISP